MSDKSSWDGIAFPWRDLDPCNSRELNSLLERLGAAPRKRWGQNFLVDRAAQQRIVGAAGIRSQDAVWEIGPGPGALTQHLWRSCRSLTLFEIDPLLLDFYRNRLSVDSVVGSSAGANEAAPKPPCGLVAGDVVKTWRSVYGIAAKKDAGNVENSDAESCCPDIVIGNLPYNTASLIMSDFARVAAFRPRCMVFTVQKEMAERWGAKEQSKAYSSFSVLLQSRFQMEHLFDLNARLFYPRPHVLSSCVRLCPREHGLSPAQLKELERFTRSIFRQRRKTIANNIKSDHGQFEKWESMLANIGIQTRQRAEEISIEQFLALGRQFQS